MTCYVVHGINAAFGAATILGDQKSLDLFIGISNLLLDVTVVVLPMPVLWNLQVAMRKKAVLSGMFGLGIM